ncbi:hypothetical protein BJAS_P3479 [Bathymodiolus japonicus methanotrophic gill symbiont]|uniref:hypothetical protein n=1 Tax=Bathymodiolus japonicus methanotrophic gill symbiont TaxID=113269 RepID=UPI001B407D8B|nr:hypothetical protein [Bathymodiolus japonicus methanotrophic gill symbiont]GFO72942.1 hypothetical protein BJAS_P3479 [Bathymodiolus japonicus methanotrophic gill symbiont]
MAVLNITTNKTRAEMVTELTNWASATKVGGNDYVWSCTDHISVQAEIDISGFTLLFANDLRIVANPGGVITVSGNIFNTYTRKTSIYLTHTASSRTAFEMVAGTGRWVGKGATFLLDGGDLAFDSATSVTQLYDVDIIGIRTTYATEARLGVAPTGEINLLSVTGCSLRFRTGSTYGKISMNPDGRGFISGDRLNSTKLLVNSTTLDGFVVQSSSARKFSVQPYTGSTYTLNFKDGSVDPDFLVGYPQASTAICQIQRTITLKPTDTDNNNVSGFKYRVSSNRVVNPGGTVTNNHTIIENQDGNYNSTYVLTAWRGVRPTGSGTYNSFRDQTIDKDMSVQFRKYGLREASFSANEYKFAFNAPAIMAKDEFTSTNAVIFTNYANASQFYDSMRSGAATHFTIPEDFITTDGKVITIKTGWKLKRSATATATIVDPTPKEIILDKDSFIAKSNTGVFQFDTFAGFVDDTVAGHTNMRFARNDGKANLVIEVDCQPGVSDPSVGVWPFSLDPNVRTGIIYQQVTGTGTQNVTFLVDPAVKYYGIAKGHKSNQSKPFVIEPTGALGATAKISLYPFQKPNGDNILPNTLTTAQTKIADMFIFDSGHVDIRLASDFASDPRWSATDKIWQFTADDFIPIAWKMDKILTAKEYLLMPQIIFINEGVLLVSSGASAAILEQDATNTATAGGEMKMSLTTMSVGRIGDTNARNTFIDNSNGTIDVRSGTPVSVSVNGGFTASSATKLDETHQRLALDPAKPLTSKPDGGITSTGITITAVTTADDEVVQTRTT